MRGRSTANTGLAGHEPAGSGGAEMIADETVFSHAFRIVIGEEGGFTNNPADPGNWTSGVCQNGRCLGTKFGISAAAYPTLDIASLTLDKAYEIYRSAYWDKICGDSLPPPLALVVFDTAVNNGVARAACWLQQAAGVAADGIIGQATLSAVAGRAGDGATLLAEFQARRLMFMAGLPTWRTFGFGWARRLCRLPYQSMQMGDAA